MKKALVGICIVLLVALGAESAFFISNANQWKLATQDAQTQKEDLNNQIATLQADKSNLVVENAKLSQEKDTLNEEMGSLSDENRTLNDKVDSLTDDLKNRTTDWQEATSELKATKDKYLCKKPITAVSFVDNSSVDQALVKYVNSTKNPDEPISAHNWSIIWTGSKYSIHTVEVYSEKDKTSYIWKFTVYFKGEDYGYHVNGIFYNDQQCWLYIEK
jgi:predicted nuclease with TOPRIM domain